MQNPLPKERVDALNEFIKALKSGLGASEGPGDQLSKTNKRKNPGKQVVV